ncbi:hypothetical protein SNEBB_007580 [Seison nebaliae]|nr:hypothetical protein SNEBB_007580 [Seison nebaliae]
MQFVLGCYFNMLYRERDKLVDTHIELWCQCSTNLIERWILIQQATLSVSQHYINYFFLQIRPIRSLMEFFGMCRWMYMSMISSDMKLNHYFNLVVLFLVQTFDYPQPKMEKNFPDKDQEILGKLNNYHFILIYSSILDMLFDILQYQYADVEEDLLYEIFDKCKSFINKPNVPVELTRNAISVLLAYVRRCKRFPLFMTDRKLDLCEEIQGYLAVIDSAGLIIGRTHEWNL